MKSFFVPSSCSANKLSGIYIPTDEPLTRRNAYSQWLVSNGWVSGDLTCAGVPRGLATLAKIESSELGSVNYKLGCANLTHAQGSERNK